MGALDQRHEGAPSDPSEAASYWTAKRALGSLTAQEEVAFGAWMADPANAQAYDETQAIWASPTHFAADPDMLTLRAHAIAAASSGKRRAGLRMAASIAAGFAVLCVGAVFADRHEARVAAPASTGQAMMAAGKRYETAVGQQRTVRLDDGSVVALNTGSLVEVAFTADGRNVRLLRGQALFRVAKNPNWPFVVTAGDRRVTAVGTAFDVRLDGKRVKVVLMEGKVRVDPVKRQGVSRLFPQLAREDLTPGEQLVTQGAEAGAVEPADLEREMSWQSGEVIFKDDTLGSAVAEMNRYSERRIVVRDPRVAALKVSGIFRTSRPENFVAAVTTYYPLAAVTNPAGATVLTWRGPA
jgi:transmembrane sensor